MAVQRDAVYRGRKKEENACNNSHILHLQGLLKHIDHSK